MEGYFAGVAADGHVVKTQRLNIIYFLSRDSHIEHPHLIRVHHFYRNAIHLFGAYQILIYNFEYMILLNFNCIYICRC